MARHGPNRSITDDLAYPHSPVGFRRQAVVGPSLSTSTPRLHSQKNPATHQNPTTKWCRFRPVAHRAHCMLVRLWICCALGGPKNASGIAPIAEGLSSTACGRKRTGEAAEAHLPRVDNNLCLAVVAWAVSECCPGEIGPLPVRRPCQGGGHQRLFEIAGESPPIEGNS